MIKVKFIRNEVEMTEFSRTTSASFASPPASNIEIPVGGSQGHKVITRNFVNAILDSESAKAVSKALELSSIATASPHQWL